MKHIFIINPGAGKGKTLKYIPIIKEIFEKIREPYAIELTEKPGHATDIVRRYVKKEICRIYSIGGDGTLNEVLNGMVGTESSLAVIPSGSGNDFIKTIIKGNYRKNILERTINGRQHSVDVGYIEDIGYFINIASIGIDAEIAQGAGYFKKKIFIPSKLAYFISVFITIFKYRSQRLKIVLDNHEETDDTLLLAVANGKYYGGGIKIAPSAEIDDGYFDICKVNRIGIAKILMLFPRAVLGKHEGLKEAVFKKVKHVKIYSDKKMLFNVDGEIVKLERVELRIVPEAVNIVIPGKA